MALWQISFSIIPKNYTEDKIRANQIEDWFNDDEFWQGAEITESIFSSINSVLPKTNSWSDSMILYGEEESNCLNIVIEKNYVESVSFRIDFRTNYENIVRNIIELCITNGFNIMNDSHSIIPLNFESINSIIQESPQIGIYIKLSSSE
jgi:hypothetical protein